MPISAVRKYWPQYEWSNVAAMIKNMKKAPERCEERFDGRLVAITGTTSGVGRQAARKYASMGATVVMVNRSEERSERVRGELVAEFGASVEQCIADLSVLSGIRKAGTYLSSQERPIDVLIHNAGLHMERRTETPDGLETNFAVHYLAPFVVTSMLLPKLKRDRAGRVLFVCSEAYRVMAWGLDLDDLQWERRRYSGIKGYGAGKIAQLLSMHRLAAELSPYGVTVNAMHPGMVRSESGKGNGPLYQWYKRHVIDTRSDSPEVSAEALYYLGASSALAGRTDSFFHLTTEEGLAPPALDPEAADALWERTVALLRDKGVEL